MARRYFSTAFVLTFFISFVSCQTTDQQQFVEGETLQVICNAETAGVQNLFPRIRIVELRRLKGTEDREMALLQQKDGTSDAISRKDFSFNDWVITLPSETDISDQLADLTSNRNLLTINATKADARCSDSALFKCIVTYVSASSEAEANEKHFNNTGVGIVTIERMTVFPLENGDYFENTTMTLTCIARGPERYEFRWHRRCTSTSSFTTFVPWPYPDDIQDKESIAIDSNDCNTYSHTQKLIFSAQLEDNDCMIRCQFGSGQDIFTPEASSNFTILVKREDATELPSADNSSSASNESLAIGLGVGLTLLVIIIIIILVYVFCFRKRNKDDKYKNEAQDNPDSNNLGTTAPPPVFYSKPNKQAKAEKNNARGASIGSEDSYPYEKDIRRKPYFDDENQGLDTDPRGPPRSGRRRSNRRSRGDSVDDSDKEQPRRYPYDQRRSSGDDSRRDDYYDSQPYASTDISRSEDELSDASGRPRPKPKRRTKYEYTPNDAEEKELHYADLDISQRSANNNRDNERDERGFENRDPIHYASIRV